jgi:pyruvate,water dikinase
MDRLRAWAAAPSGTPLPAPTEFDRAVASQATVPAAFRLTHSGIVLAAAPVSSRAVRGQPASAGRVDGTVRHRVTPTNGHGPWVLVTHHLDPALAPLLPEVAGVVAETGSSLSHLAILARELGIPAVVGAVGAVERLPIGTRVVVDGTVGAVDRVTDDTGEAAP